MSAVVKETIKHLVEASETLSKKPSHMLNVFYVKNNVFPTGAYRVHRSMLAAPALEDLFSDVNVQAAIVELGVEKFVEFDKSSWWLTIYVR